MNSRADNFQSVEGLDSVDETHPSSLLRRTAAGDAAAAEALLPRIYDELRRLAAAYLSNERKEHTLQATALVHEAWVRLIDRRDAAGADREHFLALAARAMQRVLIDHARGRATKRRGGELKRITLNDSRELTPENEVSVVELVDLIESLRDKHERMAEVVTLRTIAGLTHEEISRVLNVAESTVYTDWKVARAWISRELSGTQKD